MRYPRIFSAAGALALAATLAWSGSASSAPAPAADTAAAPVPAPAGQTVKLDGRAIPVPTADGAVSAEVRVLNPDGSVKLLIPKGFSASAVPMDLHESARLINSGPAGGGVAVSNHSEHWAHTYAYSWGGLVNDPNRRDTWLYNRLAQAEEQFAYDMVIEINYGLRPAMESEQGIPMNWSPAHAYYDDDMYDGQCQKGGYGFQGYSFSVICTSADMQATCDDSTALGCAWLRDQSVHNGSQFQPSMFVKANLPNDIERRNTTFHEIGHTLGWGHNQADSTSIMHSGPNSTSHKRITYHDTEDLSSKYRHIPTS